VNDRVSRWLVKLAYGFLSIGALGFVACWSVGWATEGRVLNNDTNREIFSKPDALRTVAVEMKGRTFYLEPDWGQNYNMSQRAILWCWLVGGLGGAYVEYRKRKDKK
jgi:hypothetical protein